MDFHWVWKAILIVIVGSLILRLAGRKSISQLTVSQTVIMISIGSLMIQPVSNRNIWVTFLIALILVLVLMCLEYFQTKNDKVENILTGKAITIIDNGQILQNNLKKLRLTVDQLEMRLRQASVQNISDVQTATIEPSGQLGFMLKEYAKPATKGDIQALINFLDDKLSGNQGSPPNVTKATPQNTNLFIEVKEKGASQKDN